jgi:hypothetical protein
MPSAPSRWKLPEAKSYPLLPGNWEAVTTIPSFLLFLWGNGNENVGDWIERCTVVQILLATRRGAAGSLSGPLREVPDTEAVIYGDGPAGSAVEQILREDGNGLPVQLAGFVENHQIATLLLECHAVVLLSEHEGLGISLLEGMACGAVPIAMRGA